MSNKPVQTLSVTGNGTHTVSGVTYLGGQHPDRIRARTRGAVTVTSGPTAKAGTGFLVWTNDNIWNNSGDPDG